MTKLVYKKPKDNCNEHLREYKTTSYIKFSEFHKSGTWYHM